MEQRQFVTFYLDNHLLGIDILDIRDINRFLDITPVQRASEYIAGLINLRGQIVTVFDLGVRLGLSTRSIDSDTHNIVLKADLVGLLVDRIGDVVTVSSDQIKSSPAYVGDIEEEFIDGLIMIDQTLLVLISVKQLLTVGLVAQK